MLMYHMGAMRKKSDWGVVHLFQYLHLFAQCFTSSLPMSSFVKVDYRAWYGLGQTYEMLHLYQYAHYYYRKAAYLRPADARMWGAVGNCLLKLGKPTYITYFCRVNFLVWFRLMAFIEDIALLIHRRYLL